MSNSLDPCQGWHFVEPDLGPDFLQRLSADDTSRQIDKLYIDLLLNPCSTTCMYMLYHFQRKVPNVVFSIPLGTALKGKN